MRIIDLSSPIDADGWEPDPVVHETMSATRAAAHMAEEMREHFGIDFDPAVLPDGALLSLDTLRLTVHTGTHVDAPSHYGPSADGGTARHIDEMPLDWFVRPGMVLDVSDAEIGTVGRERIEQVAPERSRGRGRGTL